MSNYSFNSLNQVSMWLQNILPVLKIYAKFKMHMFNPDSSGNYNKPTIIIVSMLATAICLLQAYKNNTSKVVLGPDNNPIDCRGAKSGTRYFSKTPGTISSNYQGVVADSAVGIHCLPVSLAGEKLKNGSTLKIDKLASAVQQDVKNRKLLP